MYILLQNSPGEMVPPDWPQMLLGFCQHIAAGMDYLSKKGFVHRDLAARNILVTRSKTCKVTNIYAIPIILYNDCMVSCRCITISTSRAVSR